MIEKIEQSSGNVIGYRVSGIVGKEDYAELTPQLESLIEQEGHINLLLDLAEFKWEKVSAWGADMKFGKKFRKKITKIAIVGDKKWQEWLAKVADPFYAEEAKYFSSEDGEAAWEWLQENDTI